MTTDLSTRYDPTQVEEKWYRHCIEKGYFASSVNKAREPFVVVIPPPNVTAELHMGHALNNTIQDIVVRFKRMSGRETCWLPGTDHAGIATQNVVERKLAARGKTRFDMGREKFVEEVWRWRDEYGNAIINQLKRLGCSCDWDRTRFTLDEGLSEAVRVAFVRLYEEGYIYRGKYLINWCPRCTTALSNDEIEHEEREGHLWHIKYPLEDGSGFVTVATTRPETMLGDTAVAVNPKDERYTELVGKTLVLPIVARRIPIISDYAVEKEFGTGCVKVTPAHDLNDFEIGARHNLEQVNILNDDGTLNENAGIYAGIDRFEARTRIVEQLQGEGLLEKTEPHHHSVGCCYRCKTDVEPYLSEQWFVKMKPLAATAIQASREGKVAFHPARWEKVYLSWLENVRDWCISRQLWWGHRIPVWYCRDCGKMTVSREDPTACAHCESASIEQDPDVLDTWFSSALWPFSTFGWPDEDAKREVDYYYPTDLLVTARDIIYLWVARMVMTGIKFMGRVPFSDVYIHGTILDEQGRRMSKSLGNGVDPIKLIDKYGTDAVRYALIALSTEGQDLKLSYEKFDTGRNFANKLWNVARFVMMNLADFEPPTDITQADLALEDRWILAEAARVVREATEALEGFHLNRALSAIYDFTWHSFCDWYVEWAKSRLNGASDRRTAQAVLAWCLDTVLRLVHPFMPFVTEELWHNLAEAAPIRGLGKKASAPVAESVTIAQWPQAKGLESAPEIASRMPLVQEVIRAIRNIRADMNIPAKTVLSPSVSVHGHAELEPLNEVEAELVARLANVTDVQSGVDLPKPPASAAYILQDASVSVYVPLAGVIDIAAEKVRLNTRLAKLVGQQAGSRRKLENPSFVEKAKPEVVARERARDEDLAAGIKEVKQHIADLEA